MLRLNKGCRGTSKGFRLGRYHIGDTNFQLSRVPAMSLNQSIWDLLADPIHQAQIEIPEKLSLVASQSSSANELLEATQAELKSEPGTNKPNSKVGHFGKALILSIVTLCLLVLVVMGVIGYMYFYQKTLLFGLLHKLQKLRGKTVQGQLNMAFSNSGVDGPAVKILE